MFNIKYISISILLVSVMACMSLKSQNHKTMNAKGHFETKSNVVKVILYPEPDYQGDPVEIIADSANYSSGGDFTIPADSPLKTKIGSARIISSCDGEPCDYPL